MQDGWQLITHGSDSGDAVGNEQWQCHFGRPRHPVAQEGVDVHVP